MLIKVSLKQNNFIFYKRIFVFLFICLLTGVNYSYAQNEGYIFKHITVSDGLVSNYVTALCHDNDGFIWIGTQLGLQRYDGTRFKNYIANSRDTTALHTDAISYIFEDSKRRLWIGTNDGAYILDRTTARFYNYNLYATPSNAIRAIWKIAEDKSGAIWIAGHDGYFKLNEHTNQFVAYNTILGIKPNEKTGSLTIDEQNNLWIQMADGLKFYNTKEQKLYDKNYNPHHNPIFNIQGGIVTALINKNYIWLSAIYEKKIYQYNVLTQKIKIFTFDKLFHLKGTPESKKEYTGTLFQLKNNQIVVGLPGRGLAFYNPGLNNFKIVNADNTQDYAYHNAEKSESQCLFVQDNAQNILIGNETGLNIYSPSGQQFITHGFSDAIDNSFPKAGTSDFLEMPDGDVLISYYYFNGGIVKTDSAFNFKKHYVVKNEHEKYPVNQVWNLFKDRDGMVWAPNQANSILKFNPVTEKITEKKDTALSGPLNGIAQDEVGIIWVGHWSKGLVKIDNVANTKQFFTQFKSLDINAPRRIYRILPDGDKIWAGTLQNGLQVFDKTIEKFTESYEINARNKDAISSNTVKDIIKYNSDTLVLATFMGVNIFNIHTKKFTAITVKEGLASNLTLGITKDTEGNIWVTCANGILCKINMHSLFITTYDRNDGIIDNSFDSRITMLKSGMALIAGSKSFISFNPSRIGASKPPAKVLITGFRVFEKEMLFDSLQKNNLPVQLSYNENSIRIEFASLDFWASGSIKYFYKLEGVDKDWIKGDKNQDAIYNQLNSGKYVFKIKCINRDAVYCKEITMLKININPPFWKTWWFYLLTLCGTILIIRQFIKWREKNIKAIEDEKLKVEQLNAEQYKNKLELEQIINYFSSSLINKNTVDDVLWDVAKNLIGRLGFVNCMIYLWNSDKTKMEQRAGYGPKGSIEDIKNKNFDVLPGQGVVGCVMQTKEIVVLADTSADPRYRIDDISRMSEISVPVIYNDELVAVIDSEHHQKNFFTTQHARVLSTIAALMASKINSIISEQSLQKAKIEMLEINEKFSAAKLEALRSQMNPHFIFNSLNAIQECILTNKIDAAYEYLSEFSKLQRMVLNNSAKEFITLSSEIEMLKLYLSLESLRFSRSFTYSITIENNTDPDEITVPSMLIQPYVENAIWHGLRNKDGDQFLNVHCEEKAGELTIIIDDNGVGRRKAGIIKSQKLSVGPTESKGTVLTEERITILSMKYKSKISVVVVDKENEKKESSGTKVIITLPTDIEADKF